MLRSLMRTTDDLTMTNLRLVLGVVLAHSPWIVCSPSRRTLGNHKVRGLGLSTRVLPGVSFRSARKSGEDSRVIDSPTFSIGKRALVVSAFRHSPSGRTLVLQPAYSRG